MGNRTNGRSAGATGGSQILGEPPELATARLHQVAAAGQTGALQIVGQPGGLVYFSGGRIAYAESPVTPGVEVAVLRALRPSDVAWVATVAAMQARPGRRAAAVEAGEAVARGVLSPVRLECAVQSATADALLAMLAGYGVTVTRTRFVGGQLPWIALGQPLTPAAALAETARRLRLLTAVGHRVRPDDHVARARTTGTVAVRLSSLQWDLVRLCPEHRTPRGLAWRVARGVLATTVDVCELVELGVLGAPRMPGAPTAHPTISFLAAHGTHRDHAAQEGAS